ncbi:MAG: DUF4388 domain-containing protein [Planctomycetota bacterium]
MTSDTDNPSTQGSGVITIDDGKTAVLLLEPRDSIRSELASRLEGDGYSVSVSSTVKDALHSLETADVQLGLISDQLPDGDFVDFIAMARRMDKYAYLPFIVLTDDKSPDHSVSILDAGADACIARPFLFKELFARIRVIIKRNTVMMRDARNRVGDLAGRLETLSFEEVLQVIERARKSGVLVIETPDGHTGKLFWVNGEVHHATYRRLEGPDAVVAMFRHREGRFFFVFNKPKVPHRTIRMTLPNLLLEGLRRIDEAKHSGVWDSTSMSPKIGLKAPFQASANAAKDSAAPVRRESLKSTRISAPAIALLTGRLIAGKLDGTIEFCDSQRLSELFSSDATASGYTSRTGSGSANIVWVGELDDILPRLMTLASGVDDRQIVRLLRSRMDLTPVFVANAPGGRLLRIIASPFNEIGFIGRELSEIMSVIVMPAGGQWEFAGRTDDLKLWLERARPRIVWPVGDETVESGLKQLIADIDIGPGMVERITEMPVEKAALSAMLAKALSI